MGLSRSCPNKSTHQVLCLAALVSGYPARELDMRALSVAPTAAPGPGGGESALDNERAQRAEQLRQLQTGARVLG